MKSKNGVIYKLFSSLSTSSCTAMGGPELL